MGASASDLALPPPLSKLPLSPRQVEKLPRRPDAVLDLPRLFIGGAVFGLSYNSLDFLDGDAPRQVLLAAFRAGMTAIDTSPFYTESEGVIGRVLSDPAFANEFPRESYLLITKCGRYGTKREHFDYSPERIEASIVESCQRLKTDYLDGVYLHDVEFVAEDVGNPSAGGFPLSSLDPDQLEKYGLSPSQAEIIHGPGDKIILAALRALFTLRDRGIVRAVGIAGYPLPTLLRLARLALARLGRPLDIVQSYSHLTLHNRSLLVYAPMLRAAGVRHVNNASPLSMGLLRAASPPFWHPAPPRLRAAIVESGVAEPEGPALRYGLRAGWELEVPTVVGCSTVEELEMALRAFKEGEGRQVDTEAEAVRASIERAGFADWSWASPPTPSKSALGP